MKLIMVLYLNTSIIMSQNLFFSEYAEGSSNNKYLEIYNGGSETINLNIYQLVNCRNGCDSWEHFHPFNETTSLNAADVWIFCAVDANDVVKAECDQTIANNSIFNGDDVWAIQEINTSTILDIIGEIGEDPGSGFDVAGTSNATKDHTLIRKESVLTGNTDWSTSAGTNTNNSEWIILDKDDFTNLGSHTCSACGESATCNDSSACNFDAEGECTYLLENECDCDGNVEDCAGECGGSAVEDECGDCNGLGAIYECGCTDIADGACDCAGNVDQGCGCGEPGLSGCDNQCGSTAEVDACGECGGGIIDSENCNNMEIKTVPPQNYTMVNAYPNPFNSHTLITLQTMENTMVKLDIIDLNGHIIDSIHSGYLSGLNTHTFLWDGNGNNSGIYFARISQNNKIITHKIILLK